MTFTGCSMNLCALTPEGPSTSDDRLNDVRSGRLRGQAARILFGCNPQDPYGFH